MAGKCRRTKLSKAPPIRCPPTVVSPNANKNATNAPAAHTTVPTPAIDRVFSTNEITDLILAHLDVKGLLTIVRRVCKTWLAHARNPVLQKATFRLAEKATEVWDATIPENGGKPAQEKAAELEGTEREVGERSDSEHDTTGHAIALRPKKRVARAALRGTSPLHGSLYCETRSHVRFNSLFQGPCNFPAWAICSSSTIHYIWCHEIGCIVNKMRDSDPCEFPIISKPSLLQPNVGSYNMFLTQPPTNEVLIDVQLFRVYVDDSDGYRVCTTRRGTVFSSNASAIRLGELLKQAKEMVDFLKAEEVSDHAEFGHARRMGRPCRRNNDVDDVYITIKDAGPGDAEKYTTEMLRP